jgi:hypothetical protein
MGSENFSQEQDILLECIHKALENWNKARYADERRRIGNTAAEQYKNRIQCLETIYRVLLREARMRKLSLSTRQLMDRILYSYSEQDRNL